jgi:hypothetical protein
VSVNEELALRQKIYDLAVALANREGDLRDANMDWREGDIAEVRDAARKLERVKAASGAPRRG